MLDEELRDELAGWARTARQVPVPHLALLRRRVIRRRLRIAALAGVSSLAAAGCTAALVLTVLPGPGRLVTGPAPATHPATHPATRHPTGQPPAPAGWRPAGPLPAAGASPAAVPYYVQIPLGMPRPAMVRNALTGKLAGTVHPPVSGQSFAGVAAAGDDRTFVLMATAANGTASRWYELRLGPGGHPLPLMTLRVPHLQGNGGFALSPDGRLLAVATDRDHAIEVVSLATGSVRRWGPATSVAVSALAWGGNRELAFLSGSGLHLLDVSAAGHDLATARLLVPASATFQGYGSPSLPLISADGSAVFMTMSTGQGGNSPQSARQEVVEFSGRTGRALRAVSPSTVVGGGMGAPLCASLWADPSGQVTVVECGQPGIFSKGTFVRRNLDLPYQVQSFLNGAFFAW